MTTKEFLIDGIYCKKWLADNSKANVQIVHGLGEMTEYYEEIAGFFTENNISVYMAEMRYHGRNKLDIKTDGLLYIMAEEVLTLTEYIRKESDDPIFLLSHSMGSTIAQLIVKDNADKYKAGIMTGCAYIPSPEKLLPMLEEEISGNGADAPCLKVFLEIFGKVASPFPEESTMAWVTSDMERALYYEKLPYTNVMYSNRMYKSFLEASKIIQDKDYPKEIAAKIPLMIASGSMDTVGIMGKYAEQKADEFRSAGFDVTLKIYDGYRHSIMQEKERQTVFNDILTFINKNI